MLAVLPPELAGQGKTRPFAVSLVRADQLLVAPNQETANADKGEEQAKAIDR